MSIRNQAHRIDSMKVEVQSSNIRSSLQLQQELSFQLHTKGFIQKLQETFDALVPEGEQLDIDSISFSFSAKSKESITEQLVKALMKDISDKIRSGTSHGVHIKSLSEWREEVLMYFLQFGTFPANASPLIRQETIDNIHALPLQDDPKLKSLIIEYAKRQPVILKRIFYSLGPHRMIIFMKHYFGFSEDFFDVLVHQNNELPSNTSTTDDAYTWQLILTMAAAGFEENIILEKLDLKKMTNGADRMMHSTQISITGNENKKAKDSFAQELERNGLTVSNAGIILLWHAWGNFFRDAGWVKDKEFNDEEAKQKAILFLHYAAFGQSTVVEDSLLLNKIMCNWPLNEPIDPQFYPGKEEKDSAEKIIDDWLRYWKPDRHFSHEWFRLSFLQREGVLNQRPDGNWNLDILKKTEDILIDKPSVIRYAWMDKIIFIQW